MSDFGTTSPGNPLRPEEQQAIDEARAAQQPTRRPTVPALEARLFTATPVLDHGFVRVVDYMGDDGAIVQAARVSYGRGTTKLRDDRGLIRYLMRHRHTTPLEMCELKLHVKLPIFIARQWIRHRTACLAGDSQLYFDLPAALRKGRRQRHNLAIADLHRLWHEGTSHLIPKKKPLCLEQIDSQRCYDIPTLARLVGRREESLRNMIREGRLRATRRAAASPTDPTLFVEGAAWHEFAQRTHQARVDMRPRLKRMSLRMCDEATGEIRHTQVTDIWQTGIKPVFRVTLENGYQLKMTKDHRCLTALGWQTLEQATGLRLGEEGRVVYRKDSPALAVNGVPAYQDPAWMSQRRTEGLGVPQIAAAAGVTTHTIRKWLRVHGLQFTSAERSRLSGVAQRGQRRTGARPHGPRSPEALARIRTARSGPASNFWKGGVTPSRALIGRWTRENAPRVHERHDFRCAICSGKEQLHAHHVDPVWNNPAVAWDLGNLISLCRACHQTLHARNLELKLLADVTGQVSLRDFFSRHPSGLSRSPKRRAPRPVKLLRTYSSIARIEYAGEEMTYDLSVAGPFHNFVANGFIVHNSVNEYSGRYSVLDREFYLPRAEDLAPQSQSNRQGREAQALAPEQAQAVLELLRDDAQRCYAHYQELLNEDEGGQIIDPQRDGLARELARINLTLNYYTQWYWKIDLHNLMHFLRLRIDPHAQQEIRSYAAVIGDVVAAWVPAAWEAFGDYRLHGAEFSRQELAALRLLVSGQPADLDALGLSKREQEEFRRKLEQG